MMNRRMNKRDTISGDAVHITEGHATFYEKLSSNGFNNALIMPF
jgi:hypothetical protein